MTAAELEVKEKIEAAVKERTVVEYPAQRRLQQQQQQLQCGDLSPEVVTGSHTTTHE
jgi:hypothetical protein